MIDAYRDGYRKFLDGYHLNDCPYSVNSKPYFDWMRGFEAAQKGGSVAYREGYAAHGRHYIDDCVYDEDTEQYDDWMDGYNQAGIDEILKDG